MTLSLALIFALASMAEPSLEGGDAFAKEKQLAIESVKLQADQAAKHKKCLDEATNSAALVACRSGMEAERPSRQERMEKRRQKALERQSQRAGRK